MEHTLSIEAWGGAGEHGRSCFIVQGEQSSVLLDCGGKKEAGGTYPRLVPERIVDLDAVFLSHAHEDHMAALPILLRYGYVGEVWLTRETYEQLPRYAHSWRNYVEKQGGAVPYEAEAWHKLHYRFIDEESEQEQWLPVCDGIRVCWGPSGHLPGGIWLLLELDDKLVYYSGDYCRESALLQATLPTAQLMGGRPIDWAIIDAAYGPAPESQQHCLQALETKLHDVQLRGGHALLPVPTSGRGAELLVELSERLPSFPIAAEASLLREWERLLFADKSSCWLRSEARLRFGLALGKTRIVGQPEQRAQLLKEEPHIILSPDGMMLAEPALTYARLMGDDRRNAILFTGHLSEDARAMPRRACEVLKLRYKVHQGLPDVEAMLLALRPCRYLLVHAEEEKTEQLEACLTDASLHSPLTQR